MSLQVFSYSTLFGHRGFLSSFPLFPSPHCPKVKQSKAEKVGTVILCKANQITVSIESPQVQLPFLYRF